MLLIPRAVRIWVALAPASLRKSFEGLSNEVRCVLARDPLSGHLFVFLNRLRTQVKILVWTRGGFTIVHRRLERGRFTFPSRVVEQLLARLRTGKNHSEGISSKQLDMFLAMVRGMSDGEVAEANKKLEEVAEQNGGRPEEPKPPKQPPVRRPPPANAPRVDNPILVPEAERPCPVCGAERKCVGHETTEVIDLIPAKVIVRRDRREVIACPKCDAEIVRAPMGDKVVAGGAYGSGLVSHLVVGKFRNSLPLDRQRQELERLGLSMPSSSMSDQIMWATDLLRPIWRALIAAVLGSVVMHIDGTTLDVRDKETKHQIVHGQLWGCVGDAEHAVYLFTSTGKKLGQRPGEIGPEQLLAMRKGAVCADAASLFEKSFQRADLIEIGCNMHGRRGFKKALELGDARAAVPLKAFQALYASRPVRAGPTTTRGSPNDSDARSRSTTSCSRGASCTDRSSRQPRHSRRRSDTCSISASR